jgi:hypothetical protein
MRNLKVSSKVEDGKEVGFIRAKREVEVLEMMQNYLIALTISASDTRVKIKERAKNVPTLNKYKELNQLGRITMICL